MFNFFSKKDISGPALTLENVVEKGLLTREEMLMIKKIRATREWENEAELKGIKSEEKRSHHRNS